METVAKVFSFVFPPQPSTRAEPRGHVRGGPAACDFVDPKLYQATPDVDLSGGSPPRAITNMHAVGTTLEDKSAQILITRDAFRALTNVLGVHHHGRTLQVGRFK